VSPRESHLSTFLPETLIPFRERGRKTLGAEYQVSSSRLILTDIEPPWQNSFFFPGVLPASLASLRPLMPFRGSRFPPLGNPPPTRPFMSSSGGVGRLVFLGEFSRLGLAPYLRGPSSSGTQRPPGRRDHHFSLEDGLLRAKVFGTLGSS